MPCKYDSMFTYDDGYAIVSLNNKFGYINIKGETIVECKYDEAMSFSEGLAVVVENDRMGYINMKGDVVIPCVYYPTTGNDFQDGLALVATSYTEYQIIDRKGNVIIECASTASWSKIN